jgi:hypothetical protein
MKATNLFFGFIMMVLLTAVSSDVLAQAQKRTAANSLAVQQPIFSEYRGIRLGMPAAEVRATLGEPSLKGDDQDYYVVSKNETVQIVYDAQYRTKVISIDYIGGEGAPDPKTVVGGELETSPLGLFKVVRSKELGLWVSYNRTAGPLVVVTITIQKIL